jgi:hypothetical protein
MSDTPITGDPLVVQLMRRWPGIDWQAVATFRDCEVPLGVVPEYTAFQLSDELAALEPVPVAPVVLLGRGHDDASAWGVYTSREAAQAVVDGYDAAVRAAEAAGQHGICHVGDLWVASAEEVPVNPTLADLFAGAGNLYLRPYLEREAGK